MTSVDLRVSDLTVGDIRTVVRQAGPPDAREAVVFCHGNPGPSDDWGGLIRRVGAFARAVAWDAPGFGRADKPAGFPHTVAVHASYLGATLDELGIVRAHLVMHDTGGLWGLEWAANNPARFASAVVINTGVLVGYRWHWLARVWQTPLLGELFMATTTRAGTRFVTRRTERRLSPARIDRIHDAFSDPATKRAILRMYRAGKRTAVAEWAANTAERLRPLDRPALVIWGTEDAYIPVRHAEFNRQAFPHAELSVVDGSGHWPFLDNPDRVADDVCRFLRPLLDQ